MRALFVLLCALPFSLWADATRPYRAEYQVLRGGSDLGGGYYELVALSDNHFRLGYQSDVSVLFLSDTRTETTEFQRVDGALVPMQYAMKRSGTGSDFGASIRFNHDTGTIDAQYRDRKAQFEMTSPIYDSLLYQQQLREDIAAGKMTMTYPLVYKDKLREYRYRVLGQETLELPHGKLETIKVQRLRDPKKNKRTYVWVAPSLDYIVARLAHYEDGALEADLRLEKVHFHDAEGGEDTSVYQP